MSSPEHEAYLEECKKRFKARTLYATSEDAEIWEEDPAQSAYDHLSYYYEDGVIQVYEADEYIPTNEDEIFFMMGLGCYSLVRNIRPFQKYIYDEKSDWVKEVSNATL